MEKGGTERNRQKKRRRKNKKKEGVAARERGDGQSLKRKTNSEKMEF